MKYNNYRYGGSHYGVPHYFLGGAFEKLTGKKFKDTGFGKGGAAGSANCTGVLNCCVGSDGGVCTLGSLPTGNLLNPDAILFSFFN